MQLNILIKSFLGFKMVFYIFLYFGFKDLMFQDSVFEVGLS